LARRGLTGRNGGRQSGTNPYGPFYNDNWVAGFAVGLLLCWGLTALTGRRRSDVTLRGI